MNPRLTVVLVLLAGAFWALGCSNCPLSAKIAPTVTQESLLALSVGMPEVRVHELLGDPIAGNKTSTARRPDRWYYALPACFERAGWTVEVQILDEKLFGARAAEGGLEAFRCFSGDCPPVVDAAIFGHLPVRQEGPAKRPTAREPGGITTPQNNALQLTRPAQAMEPRS